MKSEFVQIRVTTKEKALLSKRAARAGLDLSKFILSSARRDPSAQFQKITEELTVSSKAQLQLAELSDLLSALTGDELRGLPRPALERLGSTHSNYIAASIEYAAWRSAAISPEWTKEIQPLSEPYFGTSLISIRPYLLKVSPTPFRARNIFIDSTVGDRV